MPGQTYAPDVSIPDWLQIIRAEHSEIPGLDLTHQQVERLWGLDSATSDTVLRRLIGCGFLGRTTAGAYIRADRGV
jgi:hypothetical protein